MDRDEEQRLVHLSDSQIRDSFDALFWLTSDSQSSQPLVNQKDSCTDELPDIPRTEEEESALLAATSSSSASAKSSSTLVFHPSHALNPALTSQCVSPMLPLAAPMTADFLLNTNMLTPDSLSLLAMNTLANLPQPQPLPSTATAQTATAPTISSTTTSLPTLRYETVLSRPVLCDPKRKQRTSKKRKSPSTAPSPMTKQPTTSPSSISLPILVCSEDETEHKHRRTDRNAREQHRAQQITLQIAALRDLLLSTSDLQFKPDKFSTLLTAAQYIRQLQKKAQALSSEHQNLLRTLQQASDTLQRSATGKPVGQEDKVDQMSENFIQQCIPHKMLFRVCPAPMCLVRMDGRFLDANARLENLLETKLERLKNKDTTFFTVLERRSIENVFCAMSRLLEVPSALISSDLTLASAETIDKSSTMRATQALDSNTRNDDSSCTQDGTKDSFSEEVVLAHNGRKALLRITIVRSDETQIPRFFVCTFSPVTVSSSQLSSFSSTSTFAAEDSSSSSS